MTWRTVEAVEDLQQRTARIERALKAMAWWLVSAQTGFGVQDARGIEDILDGKKDEPARNVT